MNRGRRIPRAREDTYSRHADRIVAAFKAGELDFYGYGLVSFFIDEIDERLGTVPYTLTALAETLGWPLSVESLRLKLRELRRGGWIDFDVKPGQRKPWIFRLVRAAIDGGDLQVATPPALEVSSNTWRSQEAATPLAEPESASAPPSPFGGSRAELSRAERSGEENLGIEEELDQVVGETRAAESEPMFKAPPLKKKRGPDWA